MPVNIGPFTQIPSKFFSSGVASSLGHPASLVLLALCEHANRHEANRFKASDKALASETGYGSRTICDARKRLVEHGLISCSRENGESHVYELRAYSFSWAPLEKRGRQKRKPRALFATRSAGP